MQEKGIMGVAMPKLSQLYILRYERATLIDSSTIAFGNECIRLVNIVFHTSQMFPSMIGTCDIIIQYLREGLIKRHPSEHFQIIIGIDNDFSFAITDDGYFAEIKQEQYRVLIFSMNPHGQVKVHTSGVNNQMKLEWKSVVIKRTDH